MMMFYAAVGAYRIRKDDGWGSPYIQKLGKLHPVSTPEFVIWTILMWDVLSYDELKKLYYEQVSGIPGIDADFDGLLDMLLDRGLIVCGQGYTGVEALSNMLADTFVIPYKTRGAKMLKSMLHMWWQGTLSTGDLLAAWKPIKLDENERKVLQLARCTPLSTAELASCFERGIKRFRKPKDVLTKLYDQDDVDQSTLTAALSNSKCRNDVLSAVSNLYLKRMILFETA